MKLWLITQDEVSGYNTYSAAVVAAETEEAAKRTHPSAWLDTPWEQGLGSWASSPEHVESELIGDAVAGTEPGVICASFHAG